MRTVTRAILVLGIVSCAPKPPTAPGPSSAQARLEAFPSRLGDFQRGDSTTYSHLNSGLSYRYTDLKSGGTADVYRYPTALGMVCNSKCMGLTVENEIGSFKAELPLYIERHYMDSAVVIGRSSPDVPDGSWLDAGGHLEIRIFRSGQWNRSDLWIYGGTGLLLKVRATYPESRNPPLYEAFVDELVRTAAPPYECSQGRTTSQEVIQISSRQQGDGRKMAGDITRALDSLGYSRWYHDPDNGYWAAGPRFEGLLGKKGKPSATGVGVAVRLTRAPGDSLDLLVMSRPLCRGDDGPAEAMGAAAELTVGIAED